MIEIKSIVETKLSDKDNIIKFVGYAKLDFDDNNIDLIDIIFEYCDIKDITVEEFIESVEEYKIKIEKELELIE